MRAQALAGSDGILNGHSGIAQLRKTSDQNLAEQIDPMNLDDFIFSENAASPAGLGASPLATDVKHLAKDHNAAGGGAGAISIKSRKAPAAQTFVPQSVPSVHHQRHPDEFGYVTRHHRKTSIDDRRVSD